MPVVSPVDVPVTVKYPEPQRVCVDKPISLPVIQFNDISEERIIMVPTVEDEEVMVASCKAGLGEPDCNTVVKKRCKNMESVLNWLYVRDSS